MVLDKTFDIQFTFSYFKLCEKHVKIFQNWNNRVSIYHKTLLQVKTWKEISEDNLTVMWKHMKISITLLMWMYSIFIYVYDVFWK